MLQAFCVISSLVILLQTGSKWNKLNRIPCSSVQTNVFVKSFKHIKQVLRLATMYPVGSGLKLRRLRVHVMTQRNLRLWDIPSVKRVGSDREGTLRTDPRRSEWIPRTPYQSPHVPFLRLQHNNRTETSGFNESFEKYPKSKQ